MSRPKPLTIYPQPEVRGAIERIAHREERPLSKTVEQAFKAFSVMWDKDRFATLKLIESFDARQQGQTR
jgi:hypothetical protein